MDRLVKSLEGHVPSPWKLEASDPSMRTEMAHVVSKSYPDASGPRGFSRVTERVSQEVGFRPAGKAHFLWLMDSKNWNTPEAGNFKDGRYHFFIHQSPKNGPSVRWNKKERAFEERTWPDQFWNSSANRIVLIPNIN